MPATLGTMVRTLGEIIQGLIARLRGARGLEHGLFRKGDSIIRNSKNVTGRASRNSAFVMTAPQLG
jgi:hypothetical protein